jgi:hypothetical protein
LGHYDFEPHPSGLHHNISSRLMESGSLVIVIGSYMAPSVSETRISPYLSPLSLLPSMRFQQIGWIPEVVQTRPPGLVDGHAKTGPDG